MNRYTTFKQLLTWLAEIKKRNLDSHRSELVQLANDIRQLMYGFYEDVPLFENDFECYKVYEYAQDCHSCDTKFCGITLSESLISPAAIWLDGTPFDLHSNWREYKTGFRPSDSCRLESYFKVNRGPTFRDIYPIGSTPRLAFLGSQGNVGKVVTITYFDTGGQEITDTLEIPDCGKVCTSSSVIGIPDRGIRLPTGLQDPLVLLQSDGAHEGRILAEYAPHQTVPSYARLKLTGVSPGDCVYVRGTRRFSPLFFDYDVVETDNRLAFEQAAFFFENNRSSNAESLVRADYHLKTCKQLLIGEKSREENKSTIHKFSFHPSGRRRRSGLHSHRR